MEKTEQTGQTTSQRRGTSFSVSAISLRRTLSQIMNAKALMSQGPEKTLDADIEDGRKTFRNFVVEGFNVLASQELFGKKDRRQVSCIYFILEMFNIVISKCS